MKKVFFLFTTFLLLTLSCEEQLVVVPSDVMVSSITLDHSSLELVEGDSQVLTATVLPSDATDKTVSWSSSAPEVASVNSQGLVTALKEGEAVITAAVGNISASCSVIVSGKYIEVQEVSLDHTTLELVEGDSQVLTATVLPSDATDKTVSWSSSAPEVASVDSQGLVTALKEGEAVITAVAGGVSGSCSVVVSQKSIPVNAITLDYTTLTLEKASDFLLVAYIYPADATNREKTTWSSSDNSVATVDKNGLIHAVDAGKARISLSVDNVSASCEVTVIISVTAISLNVQSLELMIGDTYTLAATIYPEDATDKSIVWASSDESVAIVDNAGKVSALRKGSAVIKASTGGFSASCTLTVKNDDPESFTETDEQW